MDWQENVCSIKTKLRRHTANEQGWKQAALEMLHAEKHQLSCENTHYLSPITCVSLFGATQQGQKSDISSLRKLYLQRTLRDSHSSVGTELRWVNIFRLEPAEGRCFQKKSLNE